MIIFRIQRRLFMFSIRLTLTLFTAAIISLLPINSNASDLNFIQSSPVGSWQLREDTTTNHKGKQTVTLIRTSMVGKEQRGNEQYYWVEMEVESFKVSKKGKRKQKGDKMIVKSLMSASLFSSDPANAINNIRGFGKELIIQPGKGDPMVIRESGGFYAGLMKSLGTEMKYDFNELGNENISVRAGEFSTQKLQGTGSTEINTVISKIKVDSDTSSWISNKVPFGVVKSQGSSTMNGKVSTHKGELLEYGMSGAVSQITKTPTELPNFKL